LSAIIVETLRELAPESFTKTFEKAGVASLRSIARHILSNRKATLYKERAQQAGGWTDFRRLRVASKTPDLIWLPVGIERNRRGPSLTTFQANTWALITSKKAMNTMNTSYSLSTAPNNQNISHQCKTRRQVTEHGRCLCSIIYNINLNVGDESKPCPPQGTSFFEKTSKHLSYSFLVCWLLTPMPSHAEQHSQNQSYAQPVHVFARLCKPGQHSLKSHVNG